MTTQRKTEVLSIKTTSEIKLALRHIAKREHRSMANSLETLVMDYFVRNGLPFPTELDVTSAQEDSINNQGNK